MNVIISNKFKPELDSLEIDVSKKLEGEYAVDEIIDTFSDYIFNKMIIDITSIKEYQNIENLKKISENINVEKVIFLLDGENVNSEFLSQLVSIGIYNFTTTKEGIMYLYNNPNSYSDVVQYQDPSFLHSINKKEEDSVVNKNVIAINDQTEQKIIGIKNMTKDAGATTLVYMLKKVLSDYLNVIAIEINKKDFVFFKDKEMISIESNELKNKLEEYKDKDIIIIDLNNSSDSNLCTDILYLIEPTTIKLSKMIMLDRKVFEKLSGKKIVLNKTLINKKDIDSFEFETNLKVFYTIPPLDEKLENKECLYPLLQKLNILEIYSEQE